jgi:hypothetical protein
LGEGVVAVAVVGIILIVEASGAAAAGANENELAIFDVADVVPGGLRNIALPGGNIEAEKSLGVRREGSKCEDEENDESAHNGRKIS